MSEDALDLEVITPEAEASPKSLVPKDAADLVSSTSKALTIVFTTGPDPLLEEIEAAVRAHKPDVTTKAGRDEIASLAYKVARWKTSLDDAGKALNAERRRQNEAVDKHRQRIRDHLDELKKEALRPLDAWKKEEQERVNALKASLQALEFSPDLRDAPSGEIAAEIDRIKTIVVDDTWQEFKVEAEIQQARALHSLAELLVKAQKDEADRLELERLRAAEAERQRQEAEAQAAREDAERREREAKEAAARAEKEADEARIRAEREAKESAERAERERQEAEERERAAAERARLAAIEAADAERRRIREEEAAKAAEEARRAADQEHRGEVNREVRSAVAAKAGVSVEQAQRVVIAIVNGEIPHVSIRY
ncbi:MAG: hypothetical protein AAFX81_16485 [Pseudomonadota bacterium]